MAGDTIHARRSCHMRYVLGLRILCHIGAIVAGGTCTCRGISQSGLVKYCIKERWGWRTRQSRNRICVARITCIPRGLGNMARNVDGDHARILPLMAGSAGPCGDPNVAEDATCESRVARGVTGTAIRCSWNVSRALPRRILTCIASAMAA
jgi:hypothetical protein